MTRLLSLAVVPVLLAALAPLAIAEGPSDSDEAGPRELEHPEIVPLTVPSREVLSELGSMGIDLGDVDAVRDVVVERLNEIPGVRRTRTTLVLEELSGSEADLLRAATGALASAGG